MLAPQSAFAWGDDGHKVVALIAEHYLTPEVRNTVTALLAQDFGLRHALGETLHANMSADV
jgi:hypothetical protein